jgi:integrase/recombinase XerD
MKDTSLYQFSIGTHRAQKVIFVRFPKNTSLIAEIKSLKGSKWSKTHNCWYVPDVQEYRKLFLLPTDYLIGKNVLTKIHLANQHVLPALKNQLQLKGYSTSTIRCYTIELAQFLYFLQDFKIENCEITHIRKYLLYCINDLQLKENTLHSRINAIKFYIEKILKKPKLAIEIPRPKKQFKLPKSLSIQEIKLIFAQTNNVKHNTILKLCYGMGLRVSEIVNIKIEDIDSACMKVHIQRGKGKKDRYAQLPQSILEQLRAYYKEYQPKEYLFEGQYGGQYTVRSIQKVFKDALQRAGIHKKVGIHSLRHSYATHLLESGTDIRFIQDLLGHNNIKTTMLYTNVTDVSLRKIISPLDKM